MTKVDEFLAEHDDAEIIIGEGKIEAIVMEEEPEEETEDSKEADHSEETNDSKEADHSEETDDADNIVTIGIITRIELAVEEPANTPNVYRIEYVNLYDEDDSLLYVDDKKVDNREYYEVDDIVQVLASDYGVDEAIIEVVYDEDTEYDSQ